MLNPTNVKSTPPSYELLQSALDSTSNGIIVYKAIRDASGRAYDLQAVLVNEAGLRFSTYSRETLLGQTWLQYGGQSDERRMFLMQLLSVIEEKKVFSTEWFFPDSQRWLDLSVRPIDDGLIVSLVDIHELKVSQLALQTATSQLNQQSQEYNDVLNCSANGIVNYRILRNAEGIPVDFLATYVNDTGVRESGLSREIFLTIPYSQAPRGQERRNLLPWLLEAAKTGQPATCLLDARDQHRFYEVTATPHGPDTLTLTYTDVTAIHQLQVHQQEQAERLRAVLDTTQSGLFIITPLTDERGTIVDFQFSDANNTVAKLVGLSAGDLRGRVVSTIFGAYHHNGLFERYRDIYQREASERFEFRYIGEGLDRWFDISANRFGDELLINFMDITESKTLLLQQQQTTALLRTVMDNIHSGIALLNPLRNAAGQVVDFEFLLVNQINVEVSGRSQEEFFQHTQLSLFPESWKSGLFMMMKEVAETGVGQRRTIPYEHDNIYGWFEISIVPAANRILLSFLDVTETYQYRQSLEAKNRDLERTNENLRQFAYVASHDLQEPLRKIQSFGDILDNQFAASLGENGRDLIGRMQAAARRMSALINDLLVFSRFSNNETRTGPVDLNLVLAGITQDLELLLTESGGTLEVEPLPIIPGDRMQMQQLFQNLVSNSLKFRRPGVPPRVNISCRQVSGEQIPAEAQLDPARSYYRFDVRDNGIGFDEKYIDRIFQIFQRLHGKTSYTGTGIGLAICRKVVENHHGYITAQSRPGQGAVFQVYLPAQ